MNEGCTTQVASRHSDPRRFLPFLLLPVSVMLGLILLACGGGNAAVARNDAVPFDVSSTALADVPEGLEEASLTVKNGRFEETVLILQQDQPTTLTIQNDDDTDYRFEIVPALVDKSNVPANLKSAVAFTNPVAQTYHARLLAQDGATLMDELTVVVRAPDGANH